MLLYSTMFYFTVNMFTLQYNVYFTVKMCAIVEWRQVSEQGGQEKTYHNFEHCMFTDLTTTP